MSKKTKRILALGGVILIAALYLISIICAFIGSPLSRSILMAAMFCTIIVPCIIYGLQVFFQKHDED